MQSVGKKILASLCDNVAPPATLSIGTRQSDMSAFSVDQRLQMSLHVLLNQIETVNDPVAVNRVSLDYYIAQIDQKISQQLDAIMHHDDFKALESSWRSLHYYFSVLFL